MRTTNMRPLCVLGAAVAAAVLVSAWGPRDALAEPPHYRLELSAPKHLPACSDPKGLREVLDLVLSQELLVPPASRVLEVRVGRPPGGPYAVDLLFKDLEGHVIETAHREYPGTMECFKVLYKAALVAAIQMENREDLPEEAPPPATPEARPAPPPCPACPPAPAAPSPRPSAPAAPPSERRWFAGAGGLFALGMAPEMVGGVQFVGGRRGSFWSAEANARYTFPTETRPAGWTIVQVQTLTLALAPCLRKGFFGACGVVSGGLTWAETTNQSYPDTDGMPFVGFGLRGFLEVPFMDRLAVRLDAEGAITTVRPWVDEEIRNIPLVWVTSPIVGNFGVWLLASF